MKILFLDEVYPDAWAKLGRNARYCHGTANYWDVAIEAATPHLSKTSYWNEGGDDSSYTYEGEFDVVCSQNVGRWNASAIRDDAKKIAFVSYRANDADMLGFDCVFTSFPWLVKHLKNLGQKCEYMPLAFGEPIVCRTMGDDDDPSSIVQNMDRDLPLTFVGGLGHSHIWKQGERCLAAVAEAFDEFKWWGYAGPNLSDSLKASYQGEAWGYDYFNILLRSEITINRHGEIARGFANNMRLFEATGCGACLITEHATNLPDLFKPGVECLTYRTPDDLVFTLRAIMGNGGSSTIAARGHRRTMDDHCYENRLPHFLEVIESL